MTPPILITAIGLCYILIFGGMTLLRREGLSNQFAFEVLGATALIAAGSLLTGIPVNPILFLVFIYLLSMRARLLVDLANLLSGRGRQRDAISLLQLALRLFPDQSTRLVVLVNMGIVQLRRQNPGSAQALLEQTLEEAEGGGLGLKYEAACRYNLGLALQRQGKEADAVRQFNEATKVFPHSIYAMAAERALEQRRRGRRKAEAQSPEEARTGGTNDEGRRTEDE
jgi:tetratricopeptide (TPR) repeat protein